MKEITAEEMATGLYHATISNTIKDDLKDHDGNVILTKKEQSLMLTQYVYDLFERSGFKKSKLFLLTTYVVNNYKVKTENDFTFEMAISLDAIKKIRSFFKEIPPESHKFFKGKFLFDKDLNSIQKTLAMQWYISYCKIIDSAFQSSLKKFKIIDNK
jgi:hypothetical protein